ncbi:MAG: thioredoxin-disulfide reductase [Nanoarchaeota archaeon]
MYDIIIIGKGPAGLTAGVFSVRRGLKTLILSNPSELSQMTEATNVDNYPGIMNLSGMQLMKKLEDHALKLSNEIIEEEVLKITKIKKHFVVKTDKNEYNGRSVIISTGAKHRKTNIKGEAEFSGKGVSYCATCDCPIFKEKRVVVIGGGDAAISACLMIENIGAKEVTIMHRRDKFRAIESLVKRLEKSSVKIMWNTIPVEIKGDRTVKSITVRNVKTKKETEIPVEGIFIEIGSVPTSELARKLKIKVDDRGFIVVDKEMKTNVGGMFAAGDCTNGPLKQMITACGDGAIASTSAYEYVKEND